METNSHEDMHAGELETSVLLYALPEQVGCDYDSSDHSAQDRPDLLVIGLLPYSESGVVGRPSLASPTKGKAVLQSLSASFSGCVEMFN